MTFTVTYRGADGALREEAVEAAGRAECFAQMKARGIVPVSVKEGARKGGRNELRPSRSDHSGRSGGKPKSSIFNLQSSIILAAVLAVAGGAWWWLAAREDARPPVEKPKAVKDTKGVKGVKDLKGPKGAPAAPVATNAPAEKPLPPWNDSFMTNREMRLKYSTLFQATTNDGGLIIERYRLPNGKTWRKMIDPPPVFGNISDQAIAMVVGGAAGAPIPPVPGLDSANLDVEFIKSLEVPIQIEPGDTPRIAALKIAVKETREEIAAAIKAGDKRSVGEILSEHISLNNRQASLQGEALRALDQVRDRDGEEAAAEFLKAVNENLKSYGVAPITLGKRRVRAIDTQTPSKARP